MYIFNKYFIRLESYFKIEILVKSLSSHELSINHFGVNFPLNLQPRLMHFSCPDWFNQS